MSTDLNLDTIHMAAYDYARAHGATKDEAREVAEGVLKATRRIAEHVITAAGFAPGRWRST